MESEAIVNDDDLVIHTTHNTNQDESFCGKIFNHNIKQESRELLRIAWPTVLTETLKAGIFTQSIIFAGHLGKSELAAATLGVSFLNVTGHSVAIGLCSALETVCSQAYGAKNYRMVGVVLQRGICILAIAMIITYAFWMTTEHFLVAIGVEHHIARMVDEYIIMSIPALPALFCHTILLRYMQVQGIVQPLLYIGVVVFIIAIGLNLIFVDALGLGLSGVAVAFYLSFYLFSFLILLYVRMRKVHHLTWKGWSIDCLKGWNQFMGLAIPGMLMICIEWWSFEIGAFVIGRLGDASLAAHGILFQLGALLFMIPLGMSIAASVRVGNVLGANRPSQAKLITKLSVGMTVTIDLLVVFCLIGAREYIGMAFTKNREVISLVTKALPLIAAYVLFDATEVVCSGVVRGCGRQKIGVIINFISYDVVAIPLGIILAFVFHKGLVGLWWGIVGGLFIQATSYVVLILSTDWKRQAQLARLRTAVGGESTHNAVANGDDQSDDEGNTHSDPDLVRLSTLDQSLPSRDHHTSSTTDATDEPANDLLVDSCVVHEPDSDLLFLLDSGESHESFTMIQKQRRSLLWRRAVPLAMALLVLASLLAVRVLVPVPYKDLNMSTNSTVYSNRTVLPTLATNTSRF